MLVVMVHVQTQGCSARNNLLGADISCAVLCWASFALHCFFRLVFYDKRVFSTSHVTVTVGDIIFLTLVDRELSNGRGDIPTNER